MPLLIIAAVGAIIYLGVIKNTLKKERDEKQREYHNEYEKILKSDFLKIVHEAMLKTYQNTLKSGVDAHISLYHSKPTEMNQVVYDKYWIPYIQKYIDEVCAQKNIRELKDI